MRMLFIHGIKQEGRTAAGLLDEWTEVLVNSARHPEKFEAADIAMAYYGDALAQLTTSGPPSATGMGPAVQAIDGMSAEEAAFVTQGLMQMAMQTASTAEVDAAADLAAAELGAPAARPMSTAFGRLLVGAARLLEGISPWNGRIALQLLRQAYAYLKQDWVTEGVDSLVKPHFGTGQLVVVAHSLGTVVGFKLLRELADEGAELQVPLFVTLGSPLGVDAVRGAVGSPYAIPDNVGKWVNAYDRGDPVTLGKPLDASTFAEGIENIDSVNNTTFNAHSIPGYLSDRNVIAEIEAFL